MKKSGYDPKAIAHIEADEQERSLKEKLEEIHGSASSDRPEDFRTARADNVVINDRASKSVKGKQKTPSNTASPFPKGSYRYGEDGSVEEIIEEYADVTLEDIPIFPEAVHNPGRQRVVCKQTACKQAAPKQTVCKSKPARRPAPYEVKVTQKKKDKPAAPKKPPEVIGSGPAGHRSRVRKRFLQTGLKGFSLHEVMEILLFYTIPRRDTKSIGRELIDRFGSVHGVFDADSRELTKIPFVTERTVRLFKLIPAVADFRETLDIKRIRPYEDYSRVMQEFVPKLQKNIDGKLRIACFSADLKLMCISDIPLHDDDFTLDTIRLAAKNIIDSKCSGTVIVHSHNGNAAPTESDIDFTGRLGSILSIMGIELIDHVILGAPAPHSVRHNLNWEQLMSKG
ncbi:MAG: hypothetical protein K2N72_06310 [Oscillospiraceae bacterium]|nr:hypothetical protein [Oscillospiraceae bacterium]